MTRVTRAMGDLVLDKAQQLNELLQQPRDDLMPLSLSVGVAFSDRENPSGDIFQDAAAALQRMQEAGRRGCELY